MFMRLFYILLFVLFIQTAFPQNNCNCNENEIAFTDAYVNANQLIFRGKTLGVSKGTDYDKAVFLVSKLFKGIAPKQVTVYFDNKNACALKFTIGEDWLIYANYQKAKPFVAYCSRSRKNVINTNKNIDLMYIKSDISVDDETDKLTELCGLKKFTESMPTNENAHSNIIPNRWQHIVLILISLLAFVGIYLMLNKFWKK
jgi:hypothetical protein